MSEIQNYLSQNWDKILGVILAYFSLILPILKYLKDKRKEERNKRFENYHKLLDDLLGGQPTVNVMLDRQLAIIFELRNFTDYYPITLRILNHLKSIWTTLEIQTEIELTEKYIKASKWNKYFFKD